MIIYTSWLLMGEINENKIIVEQYRKLLSCCYHSLSAKEKKQVRDAFELVVHKYKNMRMELGIPFIFHAVNVTRIVVKEIGLGSESIVASIMHNIVLNTDVTPNYIEKKFSKRISEIVTGLANISKLTIRRSSLNAENFIKLLLTLSGDVRIILIRLADRLDYMRNIDNLPAERRNEVANETSHLYAPIAHRLGLYNLKTELEELSMQYANSEIYNDISRKLKASKKKQDSFIREFVAPIQSTLRKQGYECEIKSRLKSVSSIWNKMKKQNVEFSEIFDLFAIRIISKKILEDEKTDCWKIYSLVTNYYQPNPKRLRDWITTPKKSGYESLHTTVLGPGNRWVEVQIRTERMDEVAEKGGAAHWIYKQADYTSDIDQWIVLIREQLEHPELENSLQKGPAPSKDIFVFTPAGDLKKLPSGATALDFAYEVHTNVGNKTTGAKVNGKIVPLKHVLGNGDHVEIITSKNQKPRSDWLNFVITNRARSKIKRSVKEGLYSKADEGKEMLGRKMGQLKLPVDNHNLNRLLEFFNRTTPLELFHDLGTGKIDIGEIKLCFFPPQKAEKTAEVKEDSPDLNIPAPAVSKPGEMLIIKGMNDLHDYKFAKCCNPVFGDKIFGFVTVGKGIKIHRKNCSNARQMIERYPYRVIEAKWYTSDESGPFVAGLKIDGIDKIGVVNNISQLLTDKLRISIKTFSFSSNKKRLEGLIKVYIKDSRHLDYLISQLQNIDGVKKITRIG